MSGIFINYRGDDSQTAAALIDRELTARFGSDQVFLDARSIPAGSDFVEELLGRVRACSVLLVVIGPHWLTLTDVAGERRIDDPEDWLRREIAEAFVHGVRVIPVLMDGVQLPAEADLPDDIAGLSRRQYVPLRRRYTDVDLSFLVKRIIDADPELAELAAVGQEPDGHNKVDGTVIDPVVHARTVQGGVHVHPERPQVIPRQLPAAPKLFAGRAEELAALTDVLDKATTGGASVVISAIGGLGGIGKTWLALHWAHQQVERFPDGQLFVNLRGFDPSGEPMPPAVAVRSFLDALGVEPTAIPIDLDAQIGLYRSLVADRRMLILLDNARDTTQVTSLLPGTPACTVLVTSRRRLATLITTHGAQQLALNVLPQAEARQLLADHLGQDRLLAEPDAVTELLECAAGLPLALSIVAARATAHPDFPLSVLAEELRDHATRLDGLDAGEIPVNLRAVFGASYNALPVETATLFGLLGLAPGPDISLAAAGSLMGLPAARVRRLLRELETAHLVVQPTPGRYRMHDLIRLYAADHADLQPKVNTEAALRRLVDFYLHTAHSGDRLLDPHRDPIEIDPPAPGCRPHRLPDRTEAWTWYGAEYRCLLAIQLLAADRKLHTAVWQLAWAMDTILLRRGLLHDLHAMWQTGLAAALHGSDPIAISRAYRRLAMACTQLGRHDDARDHLHRALDTARSCGDLNAQAHTHYALTMAWQRQGDDQPALEHATSALRLYRLLQQPVWEADMLNWVGWFSARLGNYQQAHTHCQAALTQFRHHSHRGGEASTLDSLGYIAHQTGQHAQALEYYQQALTLIRNLGDAYHEADILNHLAEPHVALKQLDQARDIWQQALELYHEQHRLEEAKHVQQQLDELAESK
jgi:tetratricopeptide (TPR) repeat protein